MRYRTIRLGQFRWAKGPLQKVYDCYFGSRSRDFHPQPRIRSGPRITPLAKNTLYGRQRGPCRFDPGDIGGIPATRLPHSDPDSRMGSVSLRHDKFGVARHSKSDPANREQIACQRPRTRLQNTPKHPKTPADPSFFSAQNCLPKHPHLTHLHKPDVRWDVLCSQENVRKAPLFRRPERRRIAD